MSYQQSNNHKANWQAYLYDMVQFGKHILAVKSFQKGTDDEEREADDGCKKLSIVIHWCHEFASSKKTSE